MTHTTTTKIVSEAELFREFIEADTIRQYNWRGELADTMGIAHMLFQDEIEALGCFLSEEVTYALENEQSNEALDYLAYQLEVMADRLRTISQHFEQIKEDRETLPESAGGESRFCSIAGLKHLDPKEELREEIRQSMLDASAKAQQRRTSRASDLGPVLKATLEAFSTKPSA